MRSIFLKSPRAYRIAIKVPNGIKFWGYVGNHRFLEIRGAGIFVNIISFIVVKLTIRSQGNFIDPCATINTGRSFRVSSLHHKKHRSPSLVASGGPSELYSVGVVVCLGKKTATKRFKIKLYKRYI